MLSRAGLLLLLGLSSFLAAGASHAASSTANGCVVPDGFPDGIGVEQTCAVLQAFVNAYDRHDLKATLALLDPHIKFSDCDFVWNQAYTVVEKKEAARWLRDRFAEHDQIQGPIVVGGWIGDDEPSPLVFGFLGTRTNDALTTRGAPPFDLKGSKGILNAAGNRILGMTIGDFQTCGEARFPPGASRERTRTVIQVFLDAYNAHDIGRVLQLFSPGFHYYDCDYARQQYHLLDRKTELRAWLRARFKEHDRVAHTQILLTSTSPRVAGVSYTRTNDTLEARGLAPYTPPRLPKFVMNRRGDHIQLAGWDTTCAASP